MRRVRDDEAMIREEGLDDITLLPESRFCDILIKSSEVNDDEEGGF